MSYSLLALIVAAAACGKILLFPSYHSTDFEVHRNWMAVTFSVPLSEWYYERTSEWTLDYPPFFAYFEFLLAQFAYFVDADMLQVKNINYASPETICFQRISVMCTELLLYFAVSRYLKSSGISGKQGTIIFTLVVMNGGLIMVDNIHFQYNGMLLGILILCLDLANRKMYVSLAAAFSVLVLMKHLFATLAPVFAVYLLMTHCQLSYRTLFDLSAMLMFITRFAQLLLVAVCALGLAILPFMLTNALEGDIREGSLSSSPSCLLLPQSLAGGRGICLDGLLQIISRLFPFGRGLVHAYWAPNVWALYLVVDKGLAFLSRQYGWDIPKLFAGPDYGQLDRSSSSGLVGDYTLSYLPPISPAVSLLLVLVALLPALLSLITKSRLAQERGSVTLVRAVQYSALTSFMLGYHVHEKAILVALLPATLLLSAARKSTASQISSVDRLQNFMYLQCAAGGIVGLLPLFPNIQEVLLKGLICFSYLVLAHVTIAPVCGSLYSRLNMVTIAFLFCVYVYCDMVHPLLFRSASSGEVVLPFLPLMVYSTTCALVLIPTWGLSAYILLHDLMTTSVQKVGDHRKNM